MVVIKGISLILWLVILPCCMGLIPMRGIPEKKRNIGVVFIGGYLIMFSLCWVVTVPCILLVKYYSFRTMAVWYTAALLLASAAGVGLTVWAWRRRKWVSLKPQIDFKGMSVEMKAEWIMFFLLLFWQLYKAFTLASFDGDDAEYVAQSLVTQQSETMYLILPYTGGTTSLDIRHSLAVLPVWVAFIGRRTGIHTTILAHSILPFVLIPLTYMIYFEIGKHLLKKKGEYLPAFMVIMALLQIFGNVSIYTNETFFLTRTWQGKAVAASFVVPATIWLMLWIFDSGGEKEPGRRRKRRKRHKLRLVKGVGQEGDATAGGRGSEPGMAGKGGQAGLWLLLCLVNITAGVCTSMGVFLNMILIAAAAFWIMVAERKFSILVKAGFACVPNVVYMILYLFLHV